MLAVSCYKVLAASTQPMTKGVIPVELMEWDFFFTVFEIMMYFYLPTHTYWLGT